MDEKEGGIGGTLERGAELKGIVEIVWGRRERL